MPIRDKETGKTLPWVPGPREGLGQAAADKSPVIHGAALQLLDIVDRTFLNNATSFRAYWVLLPIGK